MEAKLKILSKYGKLSLACREYLERKKKIWDCGPDREWSRKRKCIYGEANLLAMEIGRPDLILYELPPGSGQWYGPAGKL